MSSSNTAPMPLRAQPVRRLSGTVHVPGDKSISHRSLILGALTVGETRITGLLEGEDVQNTAKVMRALGADVLRHDDGVWSVHGTGIGTLLQPEETLDFGNSGTGARLVLGMVAGHGITAVFDGDASLRKRPMGRVLAPLEQIGARVVESRDGKMPLTLKGALDPLPITYELPVPSAQVKSAVLLAGLNAPGETTVIEPVVTRDHTERMLAHFGAMLDIEGRPEGGRRITLHGRPELTPSDIAVPADPSSAAFPLVAAILAQDGEVRLNGVMINATRSGLLTTLTEMGADITLENKRDLGGEPVADLVCRPSRLKPIDVPAERAPSMIDEYPVLAVAASAAEGTTRMRGLHELRVKESDRLAAVAAGLAANGVAVEIAGDDMIVNGTGRIPGGGVVETHLDHRIAMSFLVMGTTSDQPVTIDDGAMIATSFPDFVDLMTRLGADIAPASEPVA